MDIPTVPCLVECTPLVLLNSFKTIKRHNSLVFLLSVGMCIFSHYYSHYYTLCVYFHISNKHNGDFIKVDKAFSLYPLSSNIELSGVRSFSMGSNQ